MITNIGIYMFFSRLMYFWSSNLCSYKLFTWTWCFILKLVALFWNSLFWISLFSPDDFFFLCSVSLLLGNSIFNFASFVISLWMHFDFLLLAYSLRLLHIVFVVTWCFFVFSPLHLSIFHLLFVIYDVW